MNATCNDCGDGVCILELAGDWYLEALTQQVDAFKKGQLGTHPQLETLHMLHGYARAFLCEKTQSLPPDMLPDVQGLLKGVSPKQRRLVRRAISNSWLRYVTDGEKF